jgi:thiamine kinase-like enzyme
MNSKSGQRILDILVPELANGARAEGERAQGKGAITEGEREPRANQDFLVGLRRFIDGKRIEAALPPHFRGKGLYLEDMEKLGGLTNRNYKLHVDGQALVLRLPGRGTGRFINRSTERANQEAAARAGFTPPSLFFDGRTGVKVTPYLHEARALDPSSAKDPAISAGVARLLSSFHRSSLRFVNDFDVFKLAKTYERVAMTRFARFFDEFAAVRSRIFALERPLAVDAPERVACHNDLVPENILALPGGYTLIDWEYSGMNDPCWDIASFTLESGFGEEEESSFLSEYCGGAVPPRMRARVDAYRLLQDYLWSLWSLLQETASREPAKARSYREYGSDRFSRVHARLPRVEEKFGLSPLRQAARRTRP